MPEPAELDAAVAAELARRRRSGQDPDSTQVFTEARAAREQPRPAWDDGRMWAVVVTGPRCGRGLCCPFEGFVFSIEELPELPRHEGCECRYVVVPKQPNAAPPEPLRLARQPDRLTAEGRRYTARSGKRAVPLEGSTMISRMFWCAWLAALALSTASTVWAQQAAFLHADGERIVDGQGREVLLRGMGLGGWMLQEGYMLGIKKEGTQHSIRARITDLVGKEEAERFYQLWRQNHMTSDDVDRLAEAGFNSIRLPMHYNLFTLPIEEEPVKGRDTWLTTGFEMTDSLLAWCRANRMYLILDLHAAPGGQGKDANISDYDPAKPSLWESEENRRKTVALWRKLAERYANEPWIGGYDILNEPNWTFEGKDENGRERHPGQLEPADLGALPGHHPRDQGGGSQPPDHRRGQRMGEQLRGVPRPMGPQPRDELPQVLEPEHRGSDRAVPGASQEVPRAVVARRERREHERVVPRMREPGRAATASAGRGGRTRRSPFAECIMTVTAPDEFRKVVDLLERGRRAPVTLKAPGEACSSSSRT